MHHLKRFGDYLRATSVKRGKNDLLNYVCLLWAWHGAHCLTNSGNGKSVHWGVKQIWILILVLTLASSNLEHITPYSEEGEGEERFCGDLRR